MDEAVEASEEEEDVVEEQLQMEHRPLVQLAPTRHPKRRRRELHYVRSENSPPLRHAELFIVQRSSKANCSERTSLHSHEEQRYN